MGVVLVTGGTGTLGRAVVPALRSSGHEVRVLSRTAGPEPGRVVGDLTAGTGLELALDGVDVVVHAATANGRGDVRQAANLLSAMRPDQHLVAVSIVGVDRIPLPYYRAKLQAEDRIRASSTLWTIQRATQFHDLVARIFAAQRRLPALLAPDFDVQPIDVRDVGKRLAELASAPPGGDAPDLGGPQVRRFQDLATAWRRAHGSRRPIIPVRLPGKIFGGYRTGAHTVPAAAVGTITFEEYLRSAAELRSG